MDLGAVGTGKRAPGGRRRGAAAAALFLVLAVAGTWPLAVQPTRLHLDCGGSHDAYTMLWDLWWAERAVLTGADPFFCDHVYHPHGTTLTLHAACPLYSLLGVPVQLAVPGLEGRVLAYDLLLVLSFFLSGFATYLLAARVAGPGPPAVLAGIAFSLCAFHYANLVRLHAAAIEWLPLLALAVLRLLDHVRARDGLVLGAAFVAVFHVSAEYAYMALLLGGLLVAAGWRSFRAAGPRRLGAVALAAAAPLLATVPFWLRFADEAALERSLPDHAAYFSADLVDLVLPGTRHPLWGGAAADAAARLHGGDDGFGLGVSYAVLALAAVGAHRALRGRERGRRVWVAAALASAVLALGPSLRVGGVATGVPLPHALLAQVLPFFDMARMPMRFIVVFHLATAVLAARGLAALCAGRGRAVRRALAAAAIALVLFETLAVPLAPERIDVPPAYGRIGEDPRDAALLDWPPGVGDGLLSETLHQTVHGKRLVQDLPWFLPRAADATRRTALGAGLSRLRRDLLEAGPSPPEPRLDGHRDLLRRLDVGWIVLRKGELAPGTAARCRRLLPALGALRVDEDRHTLVAVLPHRCRDR